MGNAQNFQNSGITNEMLSWNTAAFLQFELDNGKTNKENSIDDFPSLDDESFSGERPWGYMKECHEFFSSQA